MNWGIMATGTIAEKFAKTIINMRSEGERLAAVGSRDKDRAKAFAEKYEIEKSYGSYEELAADPNVDAVYIATPNNLHYENTMLCLNAGKHVLCEKPFTTCAEDAEKLYQAADEKGLFVMEGFWTRFLPLYDELLKIVGSKQFGELRHARCDYGFIANGERRERKLLSELGGGALLDIGIYNLGFLRLIMGGDPEAFESEVRLNEYGTDEFSVIQLRYPGGRTAHSLQTIGLQIERRAALYFDKASIYLPDFQAAYSMTVDPVDGASYEVKSPPDINGFEYEIREVTRLVGAGKTHSNIFRPEDSIAVLRLMDNIRRSWGMMFSFE
ncbi:MAG: Gfo/Idh/MocA family oxidoreductase [Oscillospiraceae bacterium]|nr:Gfo/Idh/MocA family oxidoreductase [Oscillospiraceae bacterium]